MATVAEEIDEENLREGEYARAPDGDLRWPAPDRDSAKVGSFSGTFEPEEHLGLLLQMEGRAGRIEAEVEAVTGRAVSRPRRWHKIFERMGILYPGEGNTRLTRIGRLLRDASNPNGLERVIAREAADVLRRYQFDNPVEKALPAGCSVHPYFVILRAASELDWKIHWDELNRELMRITRDDQLPPVIEKIRTARLQTGYADFLGAAANDSGLLNARTHPAETSAPEGKTAEGQLRDQRMTPFMRKAGFGGVFLEAPGASGGGYWKVPEDVRDIVWDAVSAVPEPRTFATEQEWIEWFCEGTLAVRPQQPPPSPAVSTPIRDLTVSILRAALDKYDSELVISDALLANLVASLRSGAGRNFNILRGVSGTGKTRLVSAIAKAVYGAAAVDIPYLTIVEVRPDWTDGSFLLGHYDPVSQRYVRERFLDALIAGIKLLEADPVNPAPVFICLDEMNLARVEYYLADCLSAMESGNPIPLDTRDDASVPASIKWPANVFLFGTINIDETTLRLSDKVLDRAQVIDTGDIELLSVMDKWLQAAQSLDENERQQVAEVVGGVWTALRPMEAHFGFRTASAIVRFINEAKISSEGHLSVDAAIDSQLVQKVLVKLRGEGDRWALPLTEIENTLSRLSATRALTAVKGMREDLERLGSFQFWN